MGASGGVGLFASTDQHSRAESWATVTGPQQDGVRMAVVFVVGNQVSAVSKGFEKSPWLRLKVRLRDLAGN